jgi:hypothetical protein
MENDVMRRSKKFRERDKLLCAAMRAEDDAVRYLDKFTPEVASVVARNVEMTLANRWEAEQAEMIRRGDPREVAAITEKHKQELDYAMARIPRNARSDAAAEQHVIQLLRKLPPDDAWWAAHKAANYLEGEFKRSKLSLTD